MFLGDYPPKHQFNLNCEKNCIIAQRGGFMNNTGAIANKGYKERKITSKTIGMGLAISDSYCEEPYFYINMWSKYNIDYSNLPEPTESAYWLDKDWMGLILPVSAVFKYPTENAQECLVEDFFQSGVEMVKELLKGNL